MGIRVCLVLIKPQVDHDLGQYASSGTQPVVENRNWREVDGREPVWMGRDTDA